MSGYLRLGVNIDHVATIRNARGGVHPDPVKAARLAAAAGADGITAHLREDRRHISDVDIDRLTGEIDLPLNLEMAATEEIGRAHVELQSLMRISYAVFCLKKKKQHRQSTTTNSHNSQLTHHQ